MILSNVEHSSSYYRKKTKNILVLLGSKLILLTILCLFFIKTTAMETHIIKESLAHGILSENLEDAVIKVNLNGELFEIITKPNIWRIILEYVGALEMFCRVMHLNTKINKTTMAILTQDSNYLNFFKDPLTTSTTKLYFVHSFANQVSLLNDHELIPFSNKNGTDSNLLSLQLQTAFNLSLIMKTIIKLFMGHEYYFYNYQRSLLYNQYYTFGLECPMFFHFFFPSYKIDVWYRIDNLKIIRLNQPLFQYVLTFAETNHEAVKSVLFAKEKGENNKYKVILEMQTKKLQETNIQSSDILVTRSKLMLLITETEKENFK